MHRQTILVLLCAATAFRGSHVEGKYASPLGWLISAFGMNSENAKPRKRTHLRSWEVDGEDLAGKRDTGWGYGVIGTESQCAHACGGRLVGGTWQSYNHKV